MAAFSLPVTFHGIGCIIYKAHHSDGSTVAP